MIWEVTSYPSGSTTISSQGAVAHYAVIGTKRCDDPQKTIEIAQEVCAWLNAGFKPAVGPATQWTAEQIALRSGHRIEARGPHFESAPGEGDWQISMLPEDIAERAAMTIKLLEAINA